MADAKITISAQDNTKQAIDSSKANVASLVTAVSTGFTAITTASGLVGKAVSTVAEGIADLTRCGVNATDELNRFSTLLGSRTEADSLLSAMDRLDDITLATKEDLSAFSQELIVMGKSQSEIQQILEATVHLSNTSGRNFTEVQGAMQRALSGSTTAIEKMMPELKSLSDDAYSTGDAFKYINEKLSDASVTIASGSFSQQLDSISTSWDRIKENIGATIVANIESTGILDSIYLMLGMIETNTARSREYGATSEKGSYWSDIFSSNQSAIDAMDAYIRGNDSLKQYSSRYAMSPESFIINALMNGLVTDYQLRSITGFNPNPTLKSVNYGGAGEFDIYNGYVDPSDVRLGYDSTSALMGVRGKDRFVLDENGQYVPYWMASGKGVNMEEQEKIKAKLHAEAISETLNAKSLTEWAEAWESVQDASTEEIIKSYTAVGQLTVSALNSFASALNYWKDGQYNAGDFGGTISSVGSIVSMFSPTVGAAIQTGGMLVGAMENIASFGDASNDSSSAASVRTATYNGATTIHINNYFDGSYIVGSGGMAELAEIIGEELDNKAYTRTGR